jgi:anti-sigma B factor antagonist
MRIDQTDFGDVTVLALKGKMTLGEGDELLKECVRNLIAAGRTKFVLNLENLAYIDSAGNGEIVRTYTTVSRQRGKLVLCNPTKRIIDLLAITKLLTVYEVYESVPEAVQSFQSVSFDVSCPICRPATWNSLLEKASLQTCTECDVRFLPRLTSGTVAPLEAKSPLIRRPVVTAHVNHLWWITYYENSYGRESVQLTLGRPSIVAITGRLDLFAFDIIEMAWRSVPPPRHVLFDTTSVQVASTVGMRKLSELCASGEAGSRGVILTRKPAAGSPEPAVPVDGPDTYVDRDRAIERLGNLRDSAQLLEVSIRCRA